MATTPPQVGRPSHRVIKVYCPHCGARYRIRASALERRRCPRCGSALDEPGARRRSKRLQVPDAPRVLTVHERLRERGIALDPPQVPRGPRLGRYRGLRELARGGMGVVLGAVDPDLGRAVAIKTLRPEYAEHLELLEKLLDEAQITAQLAHPSVIPVYDVGISPGGGPYFVMRQVQGQSLAEWVDAERAAQPSEASGRRRELPLPLTRVLRIFLKVCAALELAHARGVIHRDLKPDNIMLGRFGEVLVVDWGLARPLDAPPETAPGLDSQRVSTEDRIQTLAGSVMGTPAYMPPEQALGELDRMGPPSDVYSLGAVLYEMLTLQQPFEGPVDQVLDDVARGRLVAPSQRHPAVPRELEAVVLRAMAPRRSRRYPSVAQLRQDIEAFMAGEPVAAARYGLASRLRQGVRRHRLAAVVLLAVLLGLAALPLHGAWQRRQLAHEALARATGRVAGVATADALMRRNDRAAARDCQAALGAHLAAVGELDRALARAPGVAALRSGRRRLGRELGRLATIDGSFTLARQVFADLAHHGAAAAEIRALQDALEARRNAQTRAGKARLDAMLADLRAGLGRPGRDPAAATLQDLVLEALRWRGAWLGERLARQLEPLTAQARTGGRGAAWTPSQLALAAFCCRVLGRRGGADAIPPLARFSAVVWNDRLIREVGQALCNTRRPEAHAPLVALRTRIGNDNPGWRVVRARLARVPRPAPSEPTTAAGYRRRGIGRREAGDLTGAIADYTRAIALAPEDPRGYNLRGFARQRAKQLAGALADFSKALALAPGFSGALVNRSQVHLALGDRARALADLDRAIRVDPRATLAYNNRAILRRQLGDLRGALDDLDRALQIQPGYLNAQAQRASFRLEAGQSGSALDDATQVVERAPRDARFRVLKGRILLRLRRPAEALEEFAAAIRLQPQASAGYVGRGEAYQALGQPVQARRDHDEAIRRTPRDPGVWRARGRLRQRADALGALADFSEALRLNPRDPVNHLLRGTLYKALGRHAQAVVDLRRFLELAPRAPQRRAIEGYLRQQGGR